MKNQPSNCHPLLLKYMICAEISIAFISYLIHEEESYSIETKEAMNSFIWKSPHTLWTATPIVRQKI